MKPLTTLILALSAFGLSAQTQQYKIVSATVDLTVQGLAPSILDDNFAGVLKSVSCRVTTPVTGNPYGWIGFQTNGGNNSMLSLYGAVTANHFSLLSLALQTFGPGSGEAVGDTLRFDIGQSYYSLTMKPFMFVPATTGAMICTIERL